MKIYGFFKGSEGPTLLNQATLEVDAQMLRKLAEFFTDCADGMDSDEEWNHEHFCDFLESELDHDIVIYNSKFS